MTKIHLITSLIKLNFCNQKKNLLYLSAPVAISMDFVTVDFLSKKKKINRNLFQKLSKNHL